MKGLGMAVAASGRAEEGAGVLEDRCKPAELEAMADRWRVVPLLLKGVPYRDIHERTRVSVTTIRRVARTPARGAGGYAKAIQRQTFSHALPLRYPPLRLPPPRRCAPAFALPSRRPAAPATQHPRPEPR